MSQDLAEKYSASMISLAMQARSVVRDLNPKVLSKASSTYRVVQCDGNYCMHRTN